MINNEHSVLISRSIEKAEDAKKKTELSKRKAINAAIKKINDKYDSILSKEEQKINELGIELNNYVNRLNMQSRFNKKTLVKYLEKYISCKEKADYSKTDLLFFAGLNDIVLVKDGFDIKQIKSDKEYQEAFFHKDIIVIKISYIPESFEDIYVYHSIIKDNKIITTPGVFVYNCDYIFDLFDALVNYGIENNVLVEEEIINNIVNQFIENEEKLSIPKY